MKTYRIEQTIWTEIDFETSEEAIQWAQEHTSFDILETGEGGQTTVIDIADGWIIPNK